MKKSLLAAGASIAIAQVISYLVKLVSQVMLAKLLAPESFGIISIAATVAAAIAMISDIGIKPLVIRSKDGGEAYFINTAWTVQIIRGAWMSLIILAIAVSLYIAQSYRYISSESIYANSDLPLVLFAGAIINLLTSFQSIKLYVLERGMSFKENMLIEVLSQVVTTVVSIVLAYSLRSVWAIVIGGTVGTLFQVISSHQVLPHIRQRLSLNKEVVAELLKGGRWILASSSLSVLAYQGDKLILGAGFSASELGLYSIAFNLITIATSIPSKISNTIAMPVLSDGARKSEEDLKRVFFRSRRYFDRLMVLSGGLMYSIGPTVAHILYDKRYDGVGLLIQALSFLLVFDRVTIPQQMYIAKGQFKYSYQFSLVTTIYIVAALLVNHVLGGGLVVAALLVGFRSVPAYVLVLIFNRRHDLSDVRHEVGVLAMWPLGFAIGYIIYQIARQFIAQ